MKWENIPKELKQLKQWVCTRNDSKIPMIATVNCAASSVNPNTWCNFDEATQSVSDGNYDNIGFVFNNNGIIGIDIDTGYEDGLLSPIACDIINRCKSYTEKSKSGRGFHIFIKGDIPFKGKNNLNGVEIYKQSRFFITTGDMLLYNEIVENQEAIDYIIKTYFPESRNSDATSVVTDRIYTPVWCKPQDGKIPLRPQYPKIPDGGRNISLASLAGALHSLGYTARQIYDELVYCNNVACEPMLHTNEIQTIVNSITRYKR